MTETLNIQNVKIAKQLFFCVNQRAKEDVNTIMY